MLCCPSWPSPLRQRPNPKSSATILTGGFVAITYGDTITAMADRTEHEIRVAKIDCPESDQPFGNRAKQFTGDLVFGKVVSVKALATDKYGRTVGRVILSGDRDLSVEHVRTGLAQRCPPGRVYASRHVVRRFKPNAFPADGWLRRRAPRTMVGDAFPRLLRKRVGARRVHGA